MPSQKQLKWSQLKVGITVVVALTTLGVLIFLMSGTGGFLTKKIELKTYVDNASGLRIGAPVRLNGVDIGNVSNIRVVSEKAMHLTPVEVTMKVNTKYNYDIFKNSHTLLSTSGVLGETFIDIDSSEGSGPLAVHGDTLPSSDVPQIQDVVRASQGTLQNMDALLKRLDRIIAYVETGKGSVGKLIYDPTLYNRLSETINEFQGLVNDIGNGKGTLGKLISDETMYNKINGTLDKVNVAVDDLNAGKGTMGKLLKDPSLYDNANKTVANIRQLTDDINAGKGALGKFAKDPQFAARMQNIADKLSAIADRLDAGEGTAGKLLRDPSLYNNADQMLVETRELVKAIRQDPKKYLTIRLKIF
ncbi:MAG TPA: MlaD family protein [Terriglobales bacterium]|nr:MlaD family protein [Terriglobales bacterium]